MNKIKDLVEISKYAGERFDLVQAGGGNSSVKFNDDTMLIKASGFLLSDVNEENGYSKVLVSKIAHIVTDDQILQNKSKRERERLAANLVKIATLDKKNRPSIETLLHSLLLKYTLHTHPVIVNMITIQKNWQEILTSLFQNEKIALVEYRTPGIELAIELDKTLHQCAFSPNIIFLQNHGLIITSNNKDDIKQLNENVLLKIETFLHVDMQRYKTVSTLSSLLHSLEISNDISYLSEDVYLNEQLEKNRLLFFKTPFCPDTLVYCGIGCVEIKNFEDVQSLKQYKENYFEFPKVIICENKLFFRAINIRKAKEMEEVFKFHMMVLEQNINNEKNFLELDELAYLSNWEAEQYRQNV